VNVEHKMSEIKKIISEIYIYIDYPGEDLQDATPQDMIASLDKIKADLENLRESYGNAGKIIADGINCAIIGKPNAGKSTLLNLLSQEEIAIVHETPGTTRDIINSRVNLGRFALNLFDTAGIRETDETAGINNNKIDNSKIDEIENIGIAKARAKIEECDLIIGVFAADDLKNSKIILEIIKKQKYNNKKTILLLNKCDICDINNIDSAIFFDNFDYALISARENISDKSGISALQIIENKLEEIYNFDLYNLDSGEILTEERQYFEICEALENIESASAALKNGFTPDIAGLDLELAAQNLDRCDSKAVSEDIVSRIFKNFCVGK